MAITKEDLAVGIETMRMLRAGWARQIEDQRAKLYSERENRRRELEKLFEDMDEYMDGYYE